MYDRKALFGNELSDPKVYERFLCMTEAEVGGQGSKAQMAFMETIFNRAASRNQTIAKTLTGKYFPQIAHDRADSNMKKIAALKQKYGSIYTEVLNGSNLSNYATGNASENVGFGKTGYKTYESNGERFGVEMADVKWAAKMKAGK